MIERCAEAWNESEQADENWVKLKRKGELAKAEEYWALSKQLGSEACDLEWQIAEAKALTVKGLAAKIRAILAAEFDKRDLPKIRLALDVERIAAH